MNKRLKATLLAWKSLKLWLAKHPWQSFLIATAALILVIHFYTALFIPPSKEKTWKEIQVTEGMSFKTISRMLKEEGIIRYRGYFEILGRIEGITRKVRVGYYGLGTHMNMWEVLDALRRGRIIEYEVVIPEGYNLYQIGYVLAGTPLISDSKQFIAVAKNKNFARSLGINADTLEGYLFPDTYYFPKGTTVDGIAKLMVKHYKDVFARSYYTRATELGLSEHQIITLASIIEKEAKVPSERKLISAVYHNRLKQGMKLQADPTAVYGTKAWVTTVTLNDLKRRSPYNTYLHKGLPPGPIANPGQGAILAALYPEPVDYLFFVAQGDGSHFFSKDYNAHVKAVGRYRKNKRNSRHAQVKEVQPQIKESQQ